MTTLAETLAQQKITKPSSEKFVLLASNLGLDSTAQERWLSSGEFFLMRVPLHKLCLNYGDIFAEEETPKGRIVIDLNKNKIGKSAAGYVAKAVVVAGAEVIRKLKQAEEVFASCWVGKKSLKVLGLTLQADHMIGSNELTSQLQQLLKAKNGKDIFVIEASSDYIVYRSEGVDYRQTFAVDKVTHKITFLSQPVRVFAQGVYDRSVSKEPDGAGWPTTYTMPVGGPAGDGVNYGPKGNMLNNPDSYDVDLGSVEDALDVYLNHLAEGVWKPVSSQWAPVPAANMSDVSRVKIAAMKAGIKNFAPMDFIKWRAAMKANAQENKDLGLKPLARKPKL